jgi:hypothetical protein
MLPPSTKDAPYGLGQALVEIVDDLGNQLKVVKNRMAVSEL